MHKCKITSVCEANILVKIEKQERKTEEEGKKKARGRNEKARQERSREVGKEKAKGS